MHLRRLCYLAALVPLLLAGRPLPARADFRSDSLALFGAWRWVRSDGPWGAHQPAPASGWSRTLYFQRDGTYSFWEHDSTGDYLLCNGREVVHPEGQEWYRETWAPIWLELLGTGFESFGTRQLVGFRGSDTLVTYPGGGGIRISDTVTLTFTRESGSLEPPSRSRAAHPPPRMVPGLHGSYFASIAPQLRMLLQPFGRFSEWSDRAYPDSILASYHYTGYQIPSAVIGDFDGDSLSDVALYGQSLRDSTSLLLCLLSDHGAPRAVRLLSEPPAPVTKSGRSGPARHLPRPSLLLELYRSGRVVQGAGRLTSDAILALRLDGERVVYHYGDGGFHAGRPGDDPAGDSR